VFDWLFEGRTSIYVVLIALTALLVVLWWQTRKRWSLLAVAVALGLVGLYALLDVLVETDREQIVRKIKLMVAAVNAGDIDGAFEHIADDFRSPGRRGKEELRNLAKLYIGQRLLERVEAWDIVCVGEPSRQDGTAQASFTVKLHGPGVEGFLAACDTTFGFEAGHGWRLKSVRLLKPQTTEEWNWQL
jgi:hypothetical protein